MTDIQKNAHWYLKSVEDVLDSLRTSLKGLSEKEAKDRLDKYGPNELHEKKGRSPAGMFLEQFTDFMIIVLIVAAIVSGIIGEIVDTIAIIVIVFLNAIVGFLQEYRAEKAMQALRRISAPVATVIREGTTKKIPARELVPGDIVLLEAGAIVPADLRLVEAVQLQIQEAALTGESAPVQKHTEVLQQQNIPVADRTNMAFKGTIVTYGRGKGVVVATAMDTELGKIATMLQTEERVKTPLQKRLATLGKRLAIAILLISALVFIIGIKRGEEPILMLLTAISLAVAAIPEALPAVVTISLAMGARKMVRYNALIRKLPAVETLGSVTYICTDKTGTLTLNKMTVQKCYIDRQQGSPEEFPSTDSPDSVFYWFFVALVLNNDATRDATGDIIGDPTEVALYNAATQKGFKKDALSEIMPRVAEVPFDSTRKCMTTIHRSDTEGFVAFTKGATDVLLKKAKGMLTSEGIVPVDSKHILSQEQKMAAEGLRVLAVAMRRFESLPEEVTAETVETELILLGLVGMMDPPRPEAKEAVALCHRAGIKTVMITGDHPATAMTIARQLGIINDSDNKLMTGEKLHSLSMEEFEEVVEDIRVYARVAPEQKLKIVKALQDRGHFVAMTGDGVNDAPALKRADIGIAMGITGTDVAKEAAHMILLDDNFATIVKAVKEGRKIYDNIRKFIKYLLTTNSAEVWAIFMAPILGLPLPLLPIQILWINLITDSLPALALSVEPEEGDVMNRPPRKPKENIFSQGLGVDALWIGLLMALTVLAIQYISLDNEVQNWQSLVFTTLCFSQLFNVMAIRRERESLLKAGLMSNLPLLGAFALGVVLQLAIIYLPVLNNIFKTSPLTASQLLLSIGVSFIIYLIVELKKAIVNRPKTG